MATNNDLQQLNTFVGGMDTDTSDALLEPTKYRYAANIRLTSDASGKTGDVHLIGSPVEIAAGLLYSGSYLADILTIETMPIRNDLVVVFSCSISGVKTWSILYVLFDESTNDIAFYTVVKDIPYLEYALGDSLDMSYSYESDDNVKLYIVDGIHPMLIIPINVLGSNFLPITSVAELLKHSHYNSIILQQPCFESVIPGLLNAGQNCYAYQLYNRFGNQSEISVATNQIPIVLLNSQYSVADGKQPGSSTNMGVRIKITLDERANQFGYYKIFRVFYGQNGQLPQVDVIYDNKIPLQIQHGQTYDIYYNDTSNTSLLALTLDEFSAISGIHIIPQTIDNLYGRMFAGNIKEIGHTEVDEKLKRSGWDSRAYRFTDINYSQNTDYAGTAVLFDNQFTLPLVVYDVEDLEVSEDHDCATAYNEFVSSVPTTVDPSIEDAYRASMNAKFTYPVEGVLYYGGTGKNVSWKFVLRDIIGDSNTTDQSPELEGNPGTRASLLTNDNAISVRSDEDVQAVRSNGNIVNVLCDFSDKIGTNSTNWSYANPIVSYAYKSLRRNELYRYGIIVYDDKGQSSSVHWIADIRTPDVFEDKFCPFEVNGYTTFDPNVLYELVNKSIGIEFSVKLPSWAYAYEIVRAERTVQDSRNLYQGIVYNVMRQTRSIRNADSGQFIYLNDLLSSIRHASPIPSITCFGQMSAHKIDPSDNGTANCPTSFSEFIDPIYCFTSPEICFYDTYPDPLFVEPLNIIYGLSRRDPEDTSLYDHTTYAEINAAMLYAGAGLLKQGMKVWNISCNNLKLANLTEPYEEGFHSDNYENIYLLGVGCRTKWNLKLDISLLSLDISILLMDNVEYYSFGYNVPIQSLNNYHETNIRTAPLVDHMSVANEDLRYLTNTKSYAYIKQYNVYKDNTNHSTLSGSTKILAFAVAKLLQWNDIAEQTDSSGNASVTFNDNAVGVSGFSFVNFVDGGLSDESGISGFATSDNYGLIGPGGKCIVIKLDNRIQLINTALQPDSNDLLLPKYDDETVISDKKCILAKNLNLKFGPLLCNIRHNAVPYGGQSNVARNTTKYFSFGDICFTRNYTEQQSITVFDGDTYVMPFEWISLHKWYHPYGASHSCRHMIVNAIPVETSINLAFTNGYEFSRNASNAATNIQEKASDVNGLLLLTSDLYRYNGTYSQFNISQMHIAYDSDEYVASEFTNRIYASELKSANEYIDSWQIFKPANFIDVDSSNGPISNIRKFKNRLMFWQTLAFGVVSVNEQQIVTQTDNSSLILGTAGLLLRFDYLSTLYGMRERDFCDAQSDIALYWIDAKNSQIISYTDQVSPLSIVKNVSNAANELVGNKIGCKYRTMYDNVNKEVLFLNFYDEQSIQLMFSEKLGVFTSWNNTSTKIRPTEIGFYNNPIYLDIFHTAKNRYGLSILTNTGLDSHGAIRYVVNKLPQTVKVFDNQDIDMYIGYDDQDGLTWTAMWAKYTTAGMISEIGDFEDYISIDSSSSSSPLVKKREFDYRVSIPRYCPKDASGTPARMRGKVMECQLSVLSDLLFKLSGITTKYRISQS